MLLHLFDTSIPVAWLLVVLLTLAVSLFIVVWMVRPIRHLATALLEAFTLASCRADGKETGGLLEP